MKPEQLIRLLPVSFLTTLVAGLFLYIVGYSEEALGLLVGGIWSTLNIWALYHLFYEAFFKHRLAIVLCWLQLKVPLLYGLGYTALHFLTFDFLWAIAGFHIPIFVVLIWVVNHNLKEQNSIKNNC